MARRGRENSGEEKVTVKGRLSFENRYALAKLFYTMRLFRDAVEMSHRLLRKEELKVNEVVKKVTKFINNAHYAYSAVKKALMYLEREKLNLRKPQLYSIGKGCEKGNRNIRLTAIDRVKIKIPHAGGKHEWVEARVKFSPRHIALVDELIRLAEKGLPYSASVVLNNNKYYLHIHLPLRLYAKHTAKTRVTAKARLVAGFDINPDRICMVIVDSDGRLRDVRNEHFHEVVLAGFSGNKARDLRLKALSRLIDYACHHNVKYFVFEKIGNIPKRKMRSKRASRKVSKFAYNELLNHAKVMIKKRGGIFVQASPAYTSIDAMPLARRLGLDIHSTSAYLLAIRALKSKSINNY